MIQIITKNLRLLISAVLLHAAIMVYGQCAYCTSYENFMNNQWEELDTIYCKTHSKNHQFWWGGNDYKLTTDLESLDAVLKKEALFVKIGDSLFVNCRNLRYEKTRFGNGYTAARRIGEHSVMFVNSIIGKNAQNNAMVSGMLFGAIGAAITAANQMKQQVCYVISSGANEKGKIEIRLVNDELMDKIIDNDYELNKQYYSETKTNKRILASHVIPILEKTGIFDYVEQKQ